jgi:hypothetical protein
LFPTTAEHTVGGVTVPIKQAVVPTGKYSRTTTPALPPYILAVAPPAAAGIAVFDAQVFAPVP